MTTTKLIETHRAIIDRTRTALAIDFETPAQRIINRAFASMGVDRFDRAGNDRWEQITCELNGWEYEKPPAHLVDRWANY